MLFFAHLKFVFDRMLMNLLFSTIISPESENVQKCLFGIDGRHNRAQVDEKHSELVLSVRI